MKKINRTPAMAACLAFIFVIFCGWYTGLDFTERGIGQGNCMMFAILISGAAYLTAVVVGLIASDQ